MNKKVVENLPVGPFSLDMNSINNCNRNASPASTCSQNLHSQTVTVNEGANLKRKMCESESLPPPDFQSPSPETPHYSPSLAQRMKNDICFRCRQQGHWSRDCPRNSSNPNSRTHVVENHGFPNIHCRCGHGLCLVKVSKTQRNYLRSYYVCPIKRGKKCKTFVLWCDGPIDESYSRPPLYKYPLCSCGAGVCRKEKENSGPNQGRYYFACPVGEEHGACDYHIWEDTLLSSPSIVPDQQQDSQRALEDFWNANHIDEININYSGNNGDSLFGHSKRMKTAGNSQSLFEAQEGEDAVLMDATMERDDRGESTELSTPPKKFEVVDDLDVNSVPWEDFEEEARSLSRLSTPSSIHSRQREFERELSAASADTSFITDPMDWSGGRLVFCHPTMSLKFPKPQPFFCCVFPNFDAIIIPRQESKNEGLQGEANQALGFKVNQLLISDHGPHEQPSTGCSPTEVSGDVVSLNLSPGSQRNSNFQEKMQKQMVLAMQKELLRQLESLNPLDHESMREAAELTFRLLNNLSIDCTKFSEHVWEFINFMASLATIEISLQNDISVEEHIQHYEAEKVRLTKIRDNYVKTKVLLEESHQHSQSLRDEAFRLKTRLHEVEGQLGSCELETLKVETHLGEINTSMMEAEKSIKIAAEKADTARKLSEEKEAKLVAAMTALEEAKLELEN